MDGEGASGEQDAWPEGPGELQLALCSFGVMSGGAVPEALPWGPWRLWEAGSRGSEAAGPLQVLSRQALLSPSVGWVFSLLASGPGRPELWLWKGGLGRDWGWFRHQAARGCGCYGSASAPSVLPPPMPATHRATLYPQTLLGVVLPCPELP